MQHYQIISLDALEYEDLEYLINNPLLSDIFASYSLIKRVEPPFPTLTYTSHASILTGVNPDKHSVIHNEKRSGEWYSFFSDIKAPTILGKLEKEGIRVALLSWPTSRRAPVSALFPEIWPPLENKEEQDRLFESEVTKNVLPYFLKHKDNYNTYLGRELDSLSVDIALDILHDNLCDVMFIHLASLDCSKHNWGESSDKNYDALDYLASLLRKLKDADPLSEMIILSDHGQKDCKTIFNLQKAIDDEGYGERINLHSGSLFSYVYSTLSEEEGLSVIKKIKERYPEAIGRIFNKKELQEKWRCDGSFSFAFEGGDGIYITTEGEIKKEISPDTFHSGSHGYAPDNGPEAVFLYSSDRALGVVEEKARIIDIASTILKIIGISEPFGEGKAITL